MSGAGDPVAALDAAHARQVELLVQARGAVAEVVAARARLELQARNLRPRVRRLEARAQEDDDAATWAAALGAELAAIERGAETLAGEEAALRRVASGLELLVRQVQVRRDSIRSAGGATLASADLARALAEARREGDDLARALTEVEARVVRAREGLPAPASEEALRAQEERLWGPGAEGPGRSR